MHPQRAVAMSIERNDINGYHNPKISVIITAYNRTDFLLTAITSVLHHGTDKFGLEVIVVSNRDFSIGETLYGTNIRKIIMEGSIGEFLSEAIESATGDIIAFLDDDDIWTENKIRRLAYVFSDMRVIFYHNMYSYIDSHGNPMKYVRKTEKNNFDAFKSSLVFNFSSDPKQLREAIERRADFNLSCIAVRRYFALEYVDTLKMITSAPDGFFFWTALLSKGNLYIDNLKLTQYRVHQLNVSGSRSYEDKVKELHREIRTFELLNSLLNSVNMEDKFVALVRNWLQLYDNEYKLIAFVFNNGGKKLIIISMLSLMKTGFRTRNTLKNRALGFGILSILSMKLAKIVYINIG